MSSKKVESHFKLLIHKYLEILINFLHLQRVGLCGYLTIHPTFKLQFPGYQVPNFIFNNNSDF